MSTKKPAREDAAPDAQRATHTKRRHHRSTKFVFGGAGLAVVVVAVVLASSSSSARPETGSARSATVQATSSSPWDQHYATLTRRRLTMGVPTMMQTMTSPAHFHPQLRVIVNGRRITVPANIGIDPHQDSMQMAGLHTHDNSGTIHVEGMAGKPRLGQFFGIWGVPFSETRLGPYQANQPNVVRMWVNGEASRAYGQLTLAEGQLITVNYGPRTASARPKQLGLSVEPTARMHVR